MRGLGSERLNRASFVQTCIPPLQFASSPPGFAVERDSLIRGNVLASVI
jgi:hypothetical protein